MHRQFMLPRQHLWRGRPSRPERLPANLRLALPGESLASDADPILQRPAPALGKIELALAGVDGDRARRFARRIIDLLAGGVGHVDLLVEAARSRIIRI